MDYTYIDSTLDPDQILVQCVGFHELVDLITFSQMRFACANPTESTLLLGAARNWRAVHAQPAHRDPSPGLLGRSIALQLWDPPSALDRLAAAYDPQRPQVCLVSSAGALAEAVFPGSDGLYIGSAAGAPQSRTLVFSPLPDDRPLSAADDLRLFVDLQRALTGIVLPADAPARFRDLVLRVVQARAWVSVSFHASDPPPRHMRAPAASRHSLATPSLA